ncbi:unnamed protein product [Caenorhabditis angaria]|uniref:Saposin B-type domain-containing protein n=1 Tax=Caenorhabditis angaria TaxID=860376 RepID=A0A9P1I7J1_9PELO|nr:unnamed protein product [Caenorhabditis angaria]
MLILFSIFVIFPIVFADFEPSIESCLACQDKNLTLAQDIVGKECKDRFDNEALIAHCKEPIGDKIKAVKKWTHVGHFYDMKSCIQAELCPKMEQCKY